VLVAKSCHGAAEHWVRFHVRPDVNYRQILANGMRNLNDVYGRANTCVACHLNLDEDIRQSRAPRIIFRVRRTGRRPASPLPRHQTLHRTALLAYRTGCSPEGNHKLETRVERRVHQTALGRSRWLSSKTQLGQKELPKTTEFSAMQTAADAMARKAGQRIVEQGERRKTAQRIRRTLKSSDAKADKALLQRRAEDCPRN